MAVTLNSILQDALPKEAADPSKKYRWNYSKVDQTIKYENRSDGDALEKIYRIMDVKLNRFANVPSISKEEKMRLEELKKQIKTICEKYKSQHSSFFGRIYLLFKGLFNRGHIDDHHQNLSSSIGSLLEKPLTPNVEDLDAFLNAVCPKDDNMEISLIGEQHKKWVLHNGVIQEVAILGKAPPEVNYEELDEVFRQMAHLLSRFDHFEEITRTQKKELKRFKQLVNFRGQGARGLNNVIAPIDRLLKLPVVSTETADKIQQMQVTSDNNIQELIETEVRFVQAIASSITSLTSLQSITIPKGSPYYRFFTGKGDEKTMTAYLENCLSAFTNLKEISDRFLKQIKEAAVEESLEKRKQALADIYVSQLFLDYAKQMSVCARYYTVLSKLEQHFEKSDAFKLYFKSSRPAKGPCQNYITTVQRLPRHQMMLFELFKNSSVTSKEFTPVYKAYKKALSCSNDLNRRMNFPFKL